MKKSQAGNHQKMNRFIFILLLCEFLEWNIGVSGEDLMGSCPTNQQLKSLINSRRDDKLECFCSTDASHASEGWEVTCLRSRDAMSSMPGNGTHGSHGADADDDSSDFYTVDASPLGFTIRFSQKKVIEITCDESVPDFKPAVFQGPF